MGPLPPGPMCQSCGRPMYQDKNGGGTEMDGVTKSIEYCSDCYRDGMFTEPDVTMDEMVSRAEKRLRAEGVPEPVMQGKLWAMHRLDRWKD